MDQAHGVAGIDPHKATATVAVIEDCGGRRGCRSFTIDEAGIVELLTFLIDSELVIDRIGIEGSAFLGRPLVLALAAAGYDTREVQANRTAERRGRRRRATTDSEDAEAIARETLAHPDLPPAGKRARPHPDGEALVAIGHWRESLVLQRVRLLTEAEAVLVALPVTVRAGLPSTSRVLPQLTALTNGSVDLDGLTGADQITRDRLAATPHRHRHPRCPHQGAGHADPGPARTARRRPDRHPRDRRGHRHGPAHRDRGPLPVHQRGPVRAVVPSRPDRPLIRRR